MKKISILIVGRKKYNLTAHMDFFLKEIAVIASDEIFGNAQLPLRNTWHHELKKFGFEIFKVKLLYACF